MKKHQDAIFGVIGMTLLLLAWQWAGSTNAINPLYISYPTQVIKAAYKLFATGFIYKHLLISGQEFILGYIVAVILGISIGILVGWYKIAYSILNPYITTFYITPNVALLPLIIIWLGIGLWSKVALVFLGAFFPIVINTMFGMKSVDASFVRVAKAFNVNDFQLFKTVALPYSLPFILAGLRLAIGRALLGIIVAEATGAQGGIGYLLIFYGSTFQTDRLMVIILILIIFGVGLTELFHSFEKRVEAWRPKVNN